MKRFLISILELIVRSCDPDEVLLFGSYAKGYHNVESDLDLLVIAGLEESRTLRARELTERLNGYCIPIDLILVTPEEMEINDKPNGFFCSIRKDSKVI